MTTAPTAQALTQALQILNPSHLSLDNESQQHAHYFEGKESHFKLIIVSSDFAGLRLAARHQQVYQAVAPYLTANGGTVHALAIHAYTPDEWQGQNPASPNCAGKNPA